MKCSKCGGDVGFYQMKGNLCTECFSSRKVTAEQVQAFLDGESPDSNAEKVRELLLQRSLKGLEKYGCTTDKAGLSELEWHRHHLEELLDAAVYVMQKISDLEAKA